MVYFKKMFDGRGRDGQRGGKRREEGRDGVDKRADVAGADHGAGAWGTLCPLVKPQAWEFRLEDSEERALLSLVNGFFLNHPARRENGVGEWSE